MFLTTIRPKIITVNSGIVYVPDSHPTPSVFASSGFGGSFLVFFGRSGIFAFAAVLGSSLLL